jgi:hypothetical protein
MVWERAIYLPFSLENYLINLQLFGISNKNVNYSSVGIAPGYVLDDRGF